MWNKNESIVEHNEAVVKQNEAIGGRIKPEMTEWRSVEQNDPVYEV